MEKDLKVLMIGSDRKLFEDGSAVANRIREYGSMVGELHIVVLSDKAHNLQNKMLADNVWLYPTDSVMKFFRPMDASRIGRKIIFERKFVRGQSLITAQDPFECGWAGLQVKKKWRLPMEVQVHTDIFSPYLSGFPNWVRKNIAGKVLLGAENIRTVSESIKSSISKHCSIPLSSINVLPIFVDQSRIDNGQISFDLHTRFGWHFVLLSVSRLAPEKNLDLAIQAMALVRKRFSNVGLVIVGSGPEERRLKNLVGKLNISSHVAFVGWQNDLTSFYKTANLFIQTSLFEGYGMALVEAGLSGLPVITTPVGIAKELEHGKDAYIYPAGRPDLFAEGIIDLLENNHKREILKINLKKFLEEHLPPKEKYLAAIKDNWAKIAMMVPKNDRHV